MKNLLLNSMLAFSILMVSCKKDEVPEPDPQPTSNLSSLFNDNFSDAKQSFTINAGVYNEITGVNGVKIGVPANSFVTASGSPVTGSITISLVEILDQSNMILMDMPTTSGTNVLVSGGQLNVNASQSGSTIYLADNASISVMVPTDAYDSNMQLFDGVVDSNGDVDWILSTDDSSGMADSVIFVPDSSGGIYGAFYYFEWSDSSLGWINCDYFYNNPDGTTSITIDLAADYNQTNTAVYLHFSSINSISGVYYNGADFIALGSPINEAVTIVCISEISGQYYSAFVPVTITSGLVVPVTMNATTLADIETAINNL
ncbi:MAG: hypothetical protein IPM74_02920 [Crocinitomicaceae bacterium]|nr:hypothetical protein [Crocinitomicaceae bacterium]MBK8924869.1 hypothetical protein [Crocinitomicaceae bacterium]